MKQAPVCLQPFVMASFVPHRRTIVWQDPCQTKNSRHLAQY